MFKKFLVAVCLFCVVSQAGAYEISAGIAGGADMTPYKGDDPQWIVLPYAAFDSKYVFIEVPSAGFHIFQNDKFKVDVSVNYFFQEFKPKDNDYSYMKQLDRRRFTMTAGVSGEYKTSVGNFKLEFQADILDRSESLLAFFTYSYDFMVTKQFILIPNAGISWQNDKHNRYYYGISSDESARSGLDEYKPDATFTPYIGTKAVYMFTENVRALVGVEYIFLPSEVQDSPMVNKTGVLAGFAGVLYVF